MLPHHEPLAEEIIQLHKAKNGSFLWDDFEESYNQRPAAQQRNPGDVYGDLLAIKTILLEQHYIKLHPNNEQITILLSAGYKFISFNDKRAKEAKAFKEERSMSWPKRHWILFSFGTYIMGVLSSILFPIKSPEEKVILSQPSQAELHNADSVNHHLYSSDSFDKSKLIDTVKVGQ